jgi:hypothetical protein
MYINVLSIQNDILSRDNEPWYVCVGAVFAGRLQRGGRGVGDGASAPGADILHQPAGMRVLSHA